MNNSASTILQSLPIGIVVNSFKLGGSERQALLLATQLRQQFQVEPIIFGFRPIELLADLCQKQGIRYRILRKPPIVYTPIAWPGALLFAWYLRQNRIQILLPFSTYPNLISSLARRWSGAKICIWNQRDEGKGFKGRVVEGWALPRASCYVANSLSGAAVLEKNGVKQEKIHIIPNGVELLEPQNIRLSWRKQLNLSDEIFAACMVATLSKYKDHATLLRAWRIVVDKAPSPSPHLILAGRLFDAASDLLNLADRTGITPYVHFLGEVTDISGLLNAVDLGIYSSPSEGLPNAVLEYMASGLPVIAGDIPGVRLAIGSDQSECLVPVGDAEAMANRILELFEKPSLRKTMAAYNRERIATFFTPQIMANSMVNCILENLPPKHLLRVS